MNSPTPASGLALQIARTLHWSAQDRDQHLTMGLEAGWNAAAEQLEALAQSLA